MLLGDTYWSAIGISKGRQSLPGAASLQAAPKLASVSLSRYSTFHLRTIHCVSFIVAFAENQF